MYGTLRKGEGNHPLLNGCKYVGETKVPGFMYDLGYYPGVKLVSPSDKYVGKVPYITCEVYEVDPGTLERLDRLEGVPYLYDRMELPDGTFIYEFQHEVEDNQHIPGGDWCNR